MKRIFLLLLFLTLIYSHGNADPNITILGATTTNAGDVDPYTITPVVGSSYAWSVSGGEIISGQGTDIITVHWDSDNPGSVAVNIDNGSDIVIIDTNSSKH